ncbi:hypothetical protein QE152_g3493 [Popillia japonica]|uniref:Uncharacterized protein n=1 Tax=Popillia japonica TaxID=7064 RepID=A0AAW1N3Z4_POPJA
MQTPPPNLSVGCYTMPLSPLLNKSAPDDGESARKKVVENQNTVTELTSYGAVEEKTGRRTAKVSQIGEVGRETFTQNERKRVDRERLLARADHSMRLHQHLMLAAVVLLVMLLLFERWPHVGALILLPTQKSSQQHEPTFCPILEDYCRCTANQQEFVCKAAGFTSIPGDLPDSVFKLANSVPISFRRRLQHLE